MADPLLPLAGLRVVERTASLAGAYAGFLLRGLGAAVGRDGPPVDAVLDAGKDAAGATADVALGDEAAASLPAAPIGCRLSAWGSAGPRRHLPPDDALVAAATGLQALQWSWDGAPVWLVTPMVSYMTGILAALGVSAASLARERGGPAQTLEVSGLGGALALNTGTYVTGPGHSGSLLANGDPRGVYPTYGVYRTADGWLFVGALTQAFWTKLMVCLERVDLLAHPRLQASPLAFGSREIRALVRAELEPIFVGRTTAAWVQFLREADIPCGAVQSRAEFTRDPEAQLLGLGTWSGDDWTPPHPAAFTAGDAGPAGARSTPLAGCLDGLRVLDLSSFIAGPVCPMLLGDLGADVVKVEAADGDPFRMAAYGFVGWNRGKRSLVLDLKRPEGRDVLLDLARTADVVVDNFRGGVLDRLGLGWRALSAANPRLVHTSITGFGSDGPLAALPGFDPVFQARSGLMRAQGGDDEPVFHAVPFNDYCAGALAALATVAALQWRERHGRGVRVDVSLFRTAFVDQAAHMVRVDALRGGRDFRGPSAARRIYACADGWVCVSATTPAAQRALRDLARVPLSHDGPATVAVARRLGALGRDDALATLDAAGVPAAPCLGFDELFQDAHLRANGCFVEQDDPVLGRLVLGGPLIRFERTPIVYRRPAPRLGEHGVEILRERGFDRARVDALTRTAVVGG